MSSSKVSVQAPHRQSKRVFEVKLPRPSRKSATFVANSSEMLEITPVALCTKPATRLSAPVAPNFCKMPEGEWNAPKLSPNFRWQMKTILRKTLYQRFIPDELAAKEHEGQ